MNKSIFEKKSNTANYVDSKLLAIMKILNSKRISGLY